MQDRERSRTTKSSTVAKAAYLDPEIVAAGFATDPELNAKDVVFSQGDPADAVFDIVTGEVQLTIVSEGVIALLGPRGVLTPVSD